MNFAAGNRDCLGQTLCAFSREFRVKYYARRIILPVAP